MSHNRKIITPFFFLFCNIYRHENQNRLRVHITDADNPRWEVPYNLLPRAPPPPLTKIPKISSHFSLPSYPGSNLIVTFQPDPFSFVVTRKYTGETIFNTSGFDFVFKDQYIQISTQLKKPHLYTVLVKIHNLAVYGWNPMTHTHSTQLMHRWLI